MELTPYLVNVTNLCIFDEFMVNKYILICSGIKMSSATMTTFGIDYKHISADAQRYSRLVIMFIIVLKSLTFK